MSKSSEIERFRAIVENRLGLLFDESKQLFLEDILRRRTQATGREPGDYLTSLETSRSSENEIVSLIEALTVSETYFFRHMEQFQAFIEIVLRDRQRRQPARQKIRILSAGCASGEEAYTLAMLLHEQFPDRSPEDSTIHAVDINPFMIEKAMRARYSSWSLRETPAHFKKRWFRQDGREFVLDEKARAMVSFETLNLVHEPANWQSESMDIVFCRNVIMYLAPEHAQALIARFARALTPGGYLFLGHAETLRGLSQDFHLCHTHDTFYYQRREKLGQTSGSSAQYNELPALKRKTASSPKIIEMDSSWIEAIHRAAERIQVLTQTPAARTVDSAAWDLTETIELLRNERYSEALAHLGTLPTESKASSDVMLLRASLLTHSGHFEDARKACLELLAVDELSAGAHYLMALCREHDGDLQTAIDHDQVAVYLDPTFAMPRLHLGLIARRAKDPKAAQNELSRAATLLQREDPARIMLFGGGFSRATLVALCQAELAACGGLQ